MKYLAIFFIFVATSASAQQLSLSQKLQLRSACKADISRVCPGISPGGGRIVECIRGKMDQLSQPCVAAISKAAGQRKPTQPQL